MLRGLLSTGEAEQYFCGTCDAEVYFEILGTFKSVKVMSFLISRYKIIKILTPNRFMSKTTFLRNCFIALLISEVTYLGRKEKIYQN